MILLHRCPALIILVLSSSFGVYFLWHMKILFLDLAILRQCWWTNLSKKKQREKDSPNVWKMDFGENWKFHGKWRIKENSILESIIQEKKVQDSTWRKMVQTTMIRSLGDQEWSKIPKLGIGGTLHSQLWKVNKIPVQKKTRFGNALPCPASKISPFETEIQVQHILLLPRNLLHLY